MTEEKPDSHQSNAFENYRKIAQKFLQVLIQYVPFGSSLGVGGFFIIKQDWMMAVLTFPVMIVTVIWAAYTNSVLTRLREIYHERGRKDVDSFMVWMEALNEAIRWQFSGIEDKYLQCQAYTCQDYQIEGLTQTFIPQLDEIFVPLELSSAFLQGILPMPPGFNKDKNIPISPDDLRIWDLLKLAKSNPPYRRLLIKAWGGYGKTTLLRHIAYTYAHKRQQRGVPKLLPVLLRLRDRQAVIASENPPDLPTLIEQHHIPQLPKSEGLKFPSNWAKNRLNDGKMLIMLDGFDEVQPEWRKNVSTWIGTQMRNYPDSLFILTSRPAGYDDGYTYEHKPTAPLFIKRFNRNQIERFIRRWYRCQESFARDRRNKPNAIAEAERKTSNLLQQLDERPELADLAKNPLLLNMIANLHRSYPGEQLPQRRTELYSEIFLLQLKDRPKTRSIEILLPYTESKQVLQSLALYMVQENKPQIEYENLLEQLQIYLNCLEEPIDSSDFLQQIEQISELLVKRDEYYEFAHLSFQNYLAAVEIKQHQQENLLLQHWQNSDMWKETTLLYAAQVNPSNLIRRLCDTGNQDAIDFAYKCLQESPRKVDEALLQTLAPSIQNLQNLRYQQLETYLKNKQWKDADEETYRLMITTVGKENGQYFDREDIENFPCEELRAIDQLWVKYSNGHFGFSVQKQIWLAVGGTVDYETECKLGDRLGWRKDGEWQFDISYELQNTTPIGQLPIRCGVGVVWTGLWLKVASLLALRTVTCKI